MTKFLHLNTEEQTRGLKNSIRKLYQSRTVAAEPLSAQEIRDIALSYLTKAPGMNGAVRLNLGITLCSLKERYRKATGRAESTAKMKEVVLSIKAVEITETHIFVRLANYQGVDLNLRLNIKTDFSTVTGLLNP